MALRTRVGIRRSHIAAAAALASVMAVALIAAPAPQGGQSPQVVPTATAKALEPFLPVLPGWTKGAVDSDTSVLSETCRYTYAYALYTNGKMRVRVTVADTGFDQGSLAVLASLILTFKDDYVGQVPPSTSITRSTFKGSPAAALWDASAADGEFTVVVGGRFVAKAEGSHMDSIDTIRALVEPIDLKALSGLK